MGWVSVKRFVFTKKNKKVILGYVFYVFVDSEDVKKKSVMLRRGLGLRRDVVV